ncbi:MAG: Fe-S protein, radical SAM family [Candidatus Magasanikbacteria bacterium GW2011_GWC2_37_14]|uniref:Fe-S protein, radical SAM family n=1 Tax=Candidatus Magasanikbacteria bacterium GW2011_GWC2_37_14 TaxID=1619046 RepID=A0A0G0JII7_9BACT|nr:MAG: Fe-S protein, radical SAM family [Candidatus Magasanikbacteria bacterium GW2011_GWC2_37_14]
MSKVLLINPPFNIAKENYDSSLSVGLLSIASYLDSKGIDVKIVDGVREADYREKIIKEAKNCSYAGISLMTTQLSEALKISQLIKTTNKNCQIVWGGPHPTFFMEQCALSPLVDVVCVGEGEESFYEVVSGQELSQIRGILFRKEDKLRGNPNRPLHNPAQMPLFNWDLIDNQVLKELSFIPSLTSRGCPHICTFCINAILKLSWRPRTAEQVIEDLKIIKSKEYFKDKKLRFWDENFFVNIERAKKIINGMLENNLIFPWETTVRANYLKEGMVDDEFLEKLKQSGCYLLAFGAESGCPRILKKIKKNINPEDIINSAKMCLKHGIIPQYSFMIGLPGEEKHEMMETLKVIDQLLKLSDKVEILGPQAFRPYPGSELYDECVAAGWRAPQTLDEWVHLVENELNYLTVQNFPWVKEKDFVESMEAYVRFGAHTVKNAMASSIKAPKLLKLGFVLLCKLRWKLKFFYFPIEFKIAKKFVTK